MFADAPRKKGEDRFPLVHEIGAMYGLVDEWLKEGAVLDASALLERYKH